MKVILLEDIKNLGEKWEIKKVSDGYARNFLIPKGLVKRATKEELDKIKVVMNKKAEKATVELQKIESIIASLDGYELMVKEKADDDGGLYSSFSSEKISIALKKEGFNVPSKSIKLDKPIKQIGECAIVLNFDHNLEAEIKLVLESE